MDKQSDDYEKAIKAGVKNLPVKEYKFVRSAGRSFKPVVKNRKVVFRDGTIHKVDEKENHRNLAERVRMSKKERRRMRHAAFVGGGECG